MSIMYLPEYRKSWGILIGINKYQNVNHSGYACNDAQAIATLLVEEFNFPADNVTLLLDEEANKANIMRQFLKHANDTTEVTYLQSISCFMKIHKNTLLCSEETKIHRIAFTVDFCLKCKRNRGEQPPLHC